MVYLIHQKQLLSRITLSAGRVSSVNTESREEMKQKVNKGKLNKQEEAVRPRMAKGQLLDPGLSWFPQTSSAIK